MVGVEVMHNVLLDDGKRHAAVVVKIELDILGDCVANQNNARETLENALNEAFEGFGKITLKDSYYCTEVLMNIENNESNIDVIILSSYQYIYVMDNGEFRATSAYSTCNGQAIAAAFRDKDKKPINEEIEPKKEEKEEKENEDMAAANTSATTKSSIPAIPADFKFTVLRDVRMNGITAKAAVMVHAQLIANCENRSERLAQVQMELNKAFADYVKKIELNIKESGDVRMRSVGLDGYVSTTILQNGSTMYMYIDDRTGKIIVASNFAPQWAALKVEFAASGTPEYAFINPDYAKVREEDDDEYEEYEEAEEQESMEKENVDMEYRDKQIEALEAKLAELELANSKLAHKVLEVEDMNRKLVEQVEATEKANAELKDRVEEAEKVNDDLKANYEELSAMLEAIEYQEEAHAEVTQEQAMESQECTPIQAMGKHADAIGADMDHISERANVAKENIEGISTRAGAAKRKADEIKAEVDRKLAEMQKLACDPDNIRERLLEKLGSKKKVEVEQPKEEISTITPKQTANERLLDKASVDAVTEPIVKTSFTDGEWGKYDFCMYIPASMCKDAKAVNEAVEKALCENGIDPASLKWTQQKKEYKYDGFFFYTYTIRHNNKMYPIPLFTDSKTQWRTSAKFRELFDADFRAWLTAHGMAA